MYRRSGGRGDEGGRERNSYRGGERRHTGGRKKKPSIFMTTAQPPPLIVRGSQPTYRCVCVWIGIYRREGRERWGLWEKSQEQERAA